VCIFLGLFRGKGAGATHPHSQTDSFSFWVCVCTSTGCVCVYACVLWAYGDTILHTHHTAAHCDTLQHTATH